MDVDYGRVRSRNARRPGGAAEGEAWFQDRPGFNAKCPPPSSENKWRILSGWLDLMDPIRRRCFRIAQSVLPVTGRCGLGCRCIWGGGVRRGGALYGERSRHWWQLGGEKTGHRQL